jgi:mono/diheme cytochrome c family protein
MDNRSDQRSQESFPLFPALVLFASLGLIFALLLANAPQPASEAVVAEQTAEATVEAVVTEPTAEAVAQTETVFEPSAAYIWSCSGCHGVTGEGVTMVGPALRGSTVLQDDDAYFALLTEAHPPTSPEEAFVHPYRGGYPELTDEQIRALIDYTQTAFGGEAGAAAETVAFDPVTVYVWGCSGCHGVTGQGIDRVGPGLVDNELVTDDEAFFAYLTDAHPPINPEAQYPHPYRGGYPELNDEQLRALIDYVQSVAAVQTN